MYPYMYSYIQIHTYIYLICINTYIYILVYKYIYTYIHTFKEPKNSNIENEPQNIVCRTCYNYKRHYGKYLEKNKNKNWNTSSNK